MMSNNIILEARNIIELESPKDYIIYTNKNENTFEVEKTKVIYADNDTREVIPRGYLLSQINLSTIPDVIQDAIDTAVLDAKTQTLADSLIQTLKQSIENLNDGVYKKTYIDQAITYLEEILIQKASPEVIAAITEAKIAVATENFATTSQVQFLSSRVSASESEIIEVKETINTKDTARALQITEMEARINDTFAGYSDAIELYVDDEGNVKAEQIEKLSINFEAKVEALQQDIRILQAQNDGVIETISGSYNVVDTDNKIIITAMPYSSWLATDTTNNNTIERQLHIGDTYVKVVDDAYVSSYKFVKTTVSPTTDEEGFSWVVVTDTAAQEALSKAILAQQTADGKISTYYGTYTNMGAMSNGWTSTQKTNNIGDLYYVSDQNNKPYRWGGTSWGTVEDTRISSLSASITATNSLIAEKDGSWKANSMKLITNQYGGITGYSFQDGSGLKSNFTINADTFKISNSTNSYIPFSISGNNLVFNGKVSFSNVTGASMSGANLLYNSAPTIGFETKGWQADYNDTGIASSGLIASPETYRPIGGGGFYQYISGTPAAYKVFDIRAVAAIPVIGGQFYEGSAYLNLHRCEGRIYVGWRDSAGATITWSMGDIVTQTNTTNVLASWGRSKFIAQAPANAVSCYYYIRGTSTGEAYPYVFVSMCYFGRAAEGQTVYSNWSDGISGGATTTSELTNTAGFTTLGAVASQGYVLPAGVANAINTNTTTIDGSKITTGSINADKINTVGLIAENISANEFVGKTFTGAVINGAVINGAVVKASYLDLDGELEVLTNYHITVAMYNANPSLYTDAVYVSGTNEYRIPSISTVKEAFRLDTVSSIATLYGSIYPYNTANVGTNNKSVRIRPYFTNTSPFTIISSHSTSTHSGLANYLLSNHFRLSLGSIILFECKVEYSSAAGQYDGNLYYCTTTYSGAYFSTTTDFTNRYYTNNTDVNTNHSFNIGIGTLGVAFSSAYDYGEVNITCTLQAGTMQLSSNWDSGRLKFEQLASPRGSSTFALNSGLYINNMV